MRRSTWLLLPAIALAVVAAGCADDYSDAAGAAPPATTKAAAGGPGAGTTVEVAALDNVFKDHAITIKAGTTVHFVNRGRNDHNVVPETGTDWGAPTAAFHPGAEYSVAFDKPGTYAYYCSIHGVIKDGKSIGMVGTIEVTG